MICHVVLHVYAGPAHTHISGVKWNLADRNFEILVLLVYLSLVYPMNRIRIWIVLDPSRAHCGSLGGGEALRTIDAND